MRLKLKLMLACAALTAGCSGRTESAVPPPDRDKEIAMSNEAAGGEPVGNLPFAHGRTFATLDEYLAHLQRYAGPVGQPWYRKVGPDIYERVTTMTPRGQSRTFTRGELMRQYGFTR